jgi:hypothetical protein
VADLRRWFRITCRSLHLLSTGVLVGGHVWGASAEALRPWLVGAVLTGAGLMGTDVVQNLGYLREVRGATQLVKIALVALVALLWDLRVFILFAVVILSGVVSHMPGRYRYWVLGKGPRDEAAKEQRAGLG